MTLAPTALAAIAVTLAVAGVALAMPAYGIGLLLFAFALVLLLAYAGADKSRLLVAVFAAEMLAHFLKRALFVFESSPPISIYYALLFLPTVVIGLGLLAGLKRPRAFLPGPSAILLLLFWLLAVSTTLAFPLGASMSAKLSAIQLNLMSLPVYFLAVQTAPQRMVVIGRATAVLAILSAAYGLIQVLFGPTVVDQAWATALARQSLQASKTYDAMFGYYLFRAYSFFSDPGAYGWFLSGALGLALAVGPALRWNGLQWLAFFALILGGQFATLSRSPIGGLLVMLLMYWALGFKIARRPLIITGILAGGAFLMVAAASFLIDNFGGIALGSGAVENRLFQVGTLGDRVNSLSAFASVLGEFAFHGRGYAYGSYFMDIGDSVLQTGAHNFLVSLLSYTGLPGLLLFLGAIFAWFFEMKPLLSHERADLRRRSRWLVALVVGFIATGYVSSTGFMTFLFFAALGLGSSLAASQRHLRALPVHSRPELGAPGRTPISSLPELG